MSGSVSHILPLYFCGFIVNEFSRVHFYPNLIIESCAKKRSYLIRSVRYTLATGARVGGSANFQH